MIQDFARSRSQQFEDAEDRGANPNGTETMGDVIAARLSRRDLIGGALAVSVIAAGLPAQAQSTARKSATTTPSFDFKEVAAGSDEKIHVAEGYDADVLIRWGDKVLADATAFDPRMQTAQAQARQFGYNNDFLGYVPLMGSPTRGLLVVNHEYTNEELMFPGIGRQDTTKFARMTKELADIEMMAHGGSVIEVRKRNGKWSVAENSPYNRRITAATEMRISGPAAGHRLMRTKADATGTPGVFGFAPLIVPENGPF